MNKITQESNFRCIHCNKLITDTAYAGTAHRNHCPFCLWSKHVDDHIPGDRASDCHGDMEPIGLTFKHEGVNKYGKIKQGELMIVHICTICGKININRIAGDDSEETILSLLQQKSSPKKMSEILKRMDIDLLDKTHESQVRKQLFGIRI